MIFNPSKIDDELLPENRLAWRLGILNLDKAPRSMPFSQHDYISTEAFKSEFPLDELKTDNKSDIEKFIECNKYGYKPNSNPTIFKRKNSKPTD